MKRWIAAWVLVAWCAEAGAVDVPELRNKTADQARRKQEAESMEIETDFFKQVVDIRRQYVRQLERLLVQATREKRMDEAIAIKETLKEAEVELEDAQRLSQPPSRVERNLGYRLRKRPDDAQEHDGHYYLLVDKWMTWQEAYLWCKQHGGYLACVTDKDENGFIRKMLGRRTAWLGGTDMEKKGRWKWVTGESSRFTDWQRNQPDRNDRRSSFLRMQGQGRGGTWSSQSPDKKHHFICEWEH